MDPDEALRVIRELTAAVLAGDRTAAAELVDHFEDLDRWLTTGGFLPAAWQR